MFDYELIDDDPRSRNFRRDSEVRMMSAMKRLKHGSYFLLFSSVAIPLITYFSGPKYYAPIIGLIFCVWQIIVGIIGLRSASDSTYSKVEILRKHMNAYFKVLLLVLISYELIVITYEIADDYEHCDRFKLNRVCKKRWGVKTWKMILFMILPAVDMIVFLVFLYYRKLVQDCRINLIQRYIY